jgi:hypothetical protein
MTPHASARLHTRAGAHRDAYRRLQKTSGHCFGIVIYNENTNHNVWSDPAPRSVTRHAYLVGGVPESDAWDVTRLCGIEVP